jgi:hypothetical protein
MTDDDIRLFNELMSTQPGEQIEGLASRYPDVFEKPRLQEPTDPLKMRERIADSERKRKEQEEAEFQAKYGQKTILDMARPEFIPDDITAAIKAIGTLGSGAGAGIKGMIGEAFGMDPEATVQRNIYFPDVLEKAKSGQKLTPDEERELAFYGRYIGKGYEGLEKVSDALEYPIRAYDASKLDALMFMPGTRNISMIDDVIEMGIRGARDVAPVVKPAIQSAGQAARLAIRDDLLPLTQKATQATKEYFETPPVGAISLDALGFSSRLSEGVDKLQDKGTGPQFLAQLSKMKGVPLAEIKVTGLDEYLKNTPKVTKQEVQDYLETNRLQLIEDERIAGAGRLTAKRQVNTLPSEFDWLDREDLNEGFENKAHLRNHLIVTLNRHFDDLELQAADTGSFYARDRSGEVRYIPESRKFQWLDSEQDRIDEVLSELPDFNSATKYPDEYLIPGGENYREILYKLPDDKVEGVFRSPHFDNADNTFGSIRATDRIIDGTPTLFAEEIQSDWAIRGAKGGYGPQPMPDVDAETLRTTPDIEYRLSPDQKVFLEDLAIENDIAYFSPKSEERTKEIQRLQKKYDDWKATEKIKGSVPDNPFRGNWYKPVINNFLVKAAQEGKGGIGFPVGQIIADRYNLRTVVDTIEVKKPTEDKMTSVFITPKGKTTPFLLLVDKKGIVKDAPISYQNQFLEKPLSVVLGKEASEEILSGGSRVIKTEGMAFGGKGKEKLYDEMLPKHLNEIGKRYGVQLEKRTTPPTDIYFMPITEEMRNDILSEGLPMFKQGGHVKMAKGGPIKSALEGAGKAAAEVKKAGKLSKLKEDVRQDMGNYGAMRVERAADEIPNLEKLYSERALQEAFKGDNAKVLMTMNPKDFERFAIPLTPIKQSFPGTGPKKESLSTDEYVRYLSGVEGFHSVPFLSIDKEEFGLPLLPFISGHEGRHRNRALAMRGEESGLVQLLPRAELREPFPRRYQDEYIEALKAELGLTGNKVLPEKFNIPSNSVFDKQLQRPEIMLPDIYAKGGAVKSIVSGAQRAAKEGQKMLQGVYRGYTGERLEEPVLSTTPQRKVAEYYATRRAATRGEDPHIEMLMVDPFVGKEYGLALPIDEFNRELLTTRARAIAPSDVVERTQLKKKGGLACLSK